MSKKKQWYIDLFVGEVFGEERGTGFTHQDDRLVFGPFDSERAAEENFERMLRMLSGDQSEDWRAPALQLAICKALQIRDARRDAALEDVGTSEHARWMRD